MKVSHSTMHLSPSRMDSLHELIGRVGVVLAASETTQCLRFYEGSELKELRTPSRPFGPPPTVGELLQIPFYPDSNPDSIHVVFAPGYPRRDAQSRAISLLEFTPHHPTNASADDSQKQDEDDSTRELHESGDGMTISPLLEVSPEFKPVSLALLPPPSSDDDDSFPPSLSSRQLLALGHSGPVQLFDLQHRKIVGEIPGGPVCATFESFAGNPNDVVVGGLISNSTAEDGDPDESTEDFDFGTRIYDVEKLVCIRSFVDTNRGHSDHLTCIGYDSERRMLFTGGHDYCVCVWSYDSGELLESIDLGDIPLLGDRPKKYLNMVDPEPGYLGTGPSKLLCRPALNSLLCPLWDGSVFVSDVRFLSSRSGSSSSALGCRIPVGNRPLNDIVPQRRGVADETSFVLSMDTEPGGAIVRWKLPRGGGSGGVKKKSKVVVWRRNPEESAGGGAGGGGRRRRVQLPTRHCLASLRSWSSCWSGSVGGLSAATREWERVLFAVSRGRSRVVRIVGGTELRGFLF